MSTSTLKEKKATSVNAEIATFIGKMFSFNSSLKLHHWHITGKASYAQHIALDQAIEDLLDVTDRLVETSYALKGDLNIVIPETKNPSDIVKHAEDFFKYSETQRELFAEAFTQAIIDDYQEAIQQLLYRLKRLQ
jgi:DNA-binding ferritin-like protein